MLDAHSLEVVSRLKQSLLSSSLSNNVSDPRSFNRGNKLDENPSALNAKVVEYDGRTQVVLINDDIEKRNIREKRKWKDYYGVNGSVIDEHADSDENSLSDDEYLSDSSHPFKKIRVAEILAPLYHPSELVSHPAILKTFRLPIYSKLASDLIELIEVEQNTLNWMNKMLQVLNNEDWFYLLEENMGIEEYDHGLDEENLKNKNKDKDNEALSSEGEYDHQTITRNKSNGDKETVDPFFSLPETLKRYERLQNNFDNEQDDEFAKLKEELVNYLQVSIQRQHEYIKNLSQIRNGLVKADRIKQDLHKWGKEMYDKKSV